MEGHVSGMLQALILCSWASEGLHGICMDLQGICVELLDWLVGDDVLLLLGIRILGAFHLECWCVLHRRSLVHVCLAAACGSGANLWW